MAPVLLLILPIVSIFVAFARPRLTVLGVGREPHAALNVERCTAVQDLEACEDAWVHHSSGTAYLACSSLEMRAHWMPALEKLDGLSLPEESTDRVRLFDFKSQTHREMMLSGLPHEARGVWLHGMDAIAHPDDPSLLVLFLVSHRPPADRSRAHETGADSVVEIFETRPGSSSSHVAKWVATARHEAIRTPNNIVATGPRSFYVSNDHHRKVHWTRKLELAYGFGSDVQHCDVSSGVTECITAADNIAFPNGLAKGPNDLLYVASTMHAEVQVWEMQSDKTLQPFSLIPLERPIDNLHVSPTTGAVFAATIPRFFDFAAAAPTVSDPYRPASPGRRSMVEVWQIANETDPEQVFLGRKYRKEVALADPKGEVVSAVTSAAPWRDQLLLTGFFTPEAVVCQMPSTL
ncbi:hypothetical protein JCM8202_002680 [Rhodotorula sphaerocarpa]